MKSSDNKTQLSRREAFALAVSGLVASLPLPRAIAKESRVLTKTPAGQIKKPHYTFLHPQEASFIEAAVARLIPADEKWGGAIEADVPNYIDKQLGGNWGAGERLYRSGPWSAGTATQGYQLAFTPAELFRTALKSIVAQQKTPFAKLPVEQQDAFLKKLESESFDLDGVPSQVFFKALWQMTVEGFFSDPVYGGNRDMVSWRMIGFPGAYGSYYDTVDQHGIAINRAPLSLAEDAGGHVHVHPGIPAR